MTKARLLLMCGLPGSGKTTRAKEIASTESVVRLTKDEWQWDLGSSPWDRDVGQKLEARLWHLAQELLGHRLSVIVDFGLWARAERDELRIAGRSLGVAVELHYLAVPVAELWRRIEARNQAPPWNTEPIGYTDLTKWLQVFAPPDSDELALYDPPRGGTSSPSNVPHGGGMK